SSFHRGDGRTRRATGRSLFRGGKSEGRAWILHQQQGRWRAVSFENSRAIVREPQYSARASTGGHGQRRTRRTGQSRLRHGGMRQITMAILQSVSSFVLVLLLVLCVSCSGKRITKANVDEVMEGMSKKQVESILGPPTSLNTEDFVIMKKTTYTYRQG